VPLTCHRGWSPLVLVLAYSLVPVSAAAQESAGQAALDDLLNRRGLALKGQVAALDRQIAGLSSRIPELEREIDRLAEEAAAIDEAQEAEDEPKDKAPPRKVRFRPPLLREVTLETPIVLACINGRVAILDLDVASAAFEEIKMDQGRVQAFVDAGGGTLPAGDYDIKVSLIVVGASVFVELEAVLKEDREGEPLDLALRPDSRLGRRLQEIEPGKAAIQIAVYPDSFQEFRAVREMLWSERFDINWVPNEHGANIVLGDVGPGGVGVQ